MTVRDDQALRVGRVVERHRPNGHWCGAVKKLACTGTTGPLITHKAELNGVSSTQGGCLCATWRAPVAVGTRDWLQAGATLTLMRTSLELPDQVHP